MSDHPLQGLVKKQHVTETELDAIKQLAAICEHYEQLHMRIGWSMLQSRPATSVFDFLYYLDGMLVGYLALDNWGTDEKEVVGMVHPDYRRRGIFRSLLTAASAENKPLGMERLVLVCEHSSASGLAFVKATGASYDFSEHEMVLADFQQRLAFDDRLSFRQATAQDVDQLVTILVDSFNDPEESVRHRVTRSLQDPLRRYYIATFGETDLSCGEPVGCLRLDMWDNTIGIYSFGVRSAYQGRGYGRQILEETIRTIRGDGGQQTIMLDVDSKNSVALALYTSCGFQVKATYDYFNLSTSAI